MNSDLLTSLQIVAACRTPRSAASLCAEFELSIATLKRRLSEARNLGAHVESVKLGTRWVYHLANDAACGKRLDSWIELETKRSLVD